MPPRRPHAAQRFSQRLGAAVSACGAILPLLSACTSSHAHSDAPDAASEHDDASTPPPHEPPPLTWHTQLVSVDPDGRSDPWAFDLPNQHAIAVRSSVSSLPPQPRTDQQCFQLEDVTVQHDTIWVGATNTADFGDYCITCPERVAVGAGYGLHILPSGAADLALTSIALRVALRDCSTLTPLTAAASGVTRLQLEYTAWDPPPRAQKLALPISVVVATEHGFAQDPNLLPDALAHLAATWSQANIALSIAKPVSITPVSAPVTYSGDDRSALRALTRDARDALAGVSPLWPVLIFTSCLRRNDTVTGGRTEPLAVTPHLPGGFGLGSEPDLILIAAERCEGLSPGARFLDANTLGAVLAHELGHYLGLYHVRENDGREDNLPDTSADQDNLMQVMPAPDALTLTDMQIQVSRRHPILATAAE